MAEPIQELEAAIRAKFDEESAKKAEQSAVQLKNTLHKLLGAIGIGFSLNALKNFGKQAMAAASDLEQMEGKFKQVFGEVADIAESKAEAMGEKMGRSTTTIKRYMSDSQNLLAGFMGDSVEARTQAMDLSEKMTELAINISAFANTDEATAVNQMTRAVMGQSQAALALGAKLDDVTRQEAMLKHGIQGTYDTMSMADRMMVNYYTIMDQSRDAMDSCVREIDGFESQQRQLNSRLLEFKQTVGGFLLPFASRITRIENDLLRKMTAGLKSLGKINEEGTKLNKILVIFNSAMDRVQRFIDRVFQVGGRVVNLMGGAENVLKLIGIAIGAIAAYNIAKWLSGISLALDPMKAKILLIVGVLILVGLAIEDVIGFLQGKDSMIGRLLESWGVDTDALREKILTAFDKAREIGGQVLEFLMQMAADAYQSFLDFGNWLETTFGPLWNTIKETVSNLFQYFIDNLPGIVQGFTDFWSWLSETFAPIWDTIKGAADILFTFLAENIQANVQSFQDFFGKLDEIAKFLVETFQPAWDALVGVLKGLFEDAANNAPEMLQKLQDFLDKVTEIREYIGEKMQPIMDAISGVIQSILEKIGEELPGIIETLGNLFTNVQDLRKEIGEQLQPVFDALQPVLEKAEELFKAIFDYLAEKAPGAIEEIGNKFTEGIGKIQPFLDMLNQIIDAIKAIITGDWTGLSDSLSGAWNDFKEVIDGTPVGKVVGFVEDHLPGHNDEEASSAAFPNQNTLPNVIEETSSPIQGMIDSAKDWGKDTVGNFVEGVTEFGSNLKNAALDLAGDFFSVWHHSTPEEGPLVDDDQWMPDMMDNFINGINSRRGALRKMIKMVADDISVLKDAMQLDMPGWKALMGTGTASPQTAGNAVSNTSNSTVVQTNNFTNTFNGGDSLGEASKQMRKNALNATGLLASALNNGR